MKNLIMTNNLMEIAEQMTVSQMMERLVMVVQNLIQMMIPTDLGAFVGSPMATGMP